MYNCSNYAYVNREVFCTVFISIPSSAIGAANREVTRMLQACNPEVRHSKKRGVDQKCSAENSVNNVPRNEDCPLLCFLSSTLSRCRQDIDHQYGMVPLAVQFVFNAWFHISFIY